MDFGSCFDLIEEPIAGLLETKKGGNDPKDIATALCSTEGNTVRIDCLRPFALSLSKGSYTLRQAQGERISAQPNSIGTEGASRFNPALMCRIGSVVSLSGTGS